jgi:hypothetical protein
MSDALQAAINQLDVCQARCDSARSDHAGLGKSHDVLRDFHKQLTSAAADGDVGKARALCDSMGTALRETKRRHDDLATDHDGLQRALDAAKLAVQGARDASGSDGWTDPTADQAENAAGGMTTAGPSGNGNPPRSYSREDVEARDRRQAVTSAYRAKIDELRRRH